MNQIFFWSLLIRLFLDLDDITTLLIFVADNLIFVNYDEGMLEAFSMRASCSVARLVCSTVLLLLLLLLAALPCDADVTDWAVAFGLKVLDAWVFRWLLAGTTFLLPISGWARMCIFWLALEFDSLVSCFWFFRPFSCTMLRLSD